MFTHMRCFVVLMNFIKNLLPNQFLVKNKILRKSPEKNLPLSGRAWARVRANSRASARVRAWAKSCAMGGEHL